MLKEIAGLTPLVALAALCAVIYLLRYCWQPASWPKSTIKTASVLLLAVASYLAYSPIWLTLALALCALGDYLLSRDSEATFLAGVGAFAAGHIAYITLFVTHSAAQPERMFMGPRLWVICFLAALALSVAKVRYSRAGDLRFAVLAYVPIIVGMGIAALVLPTLG
ncbi:MAG: lysoplasmalogenase, partial [Alphaproteobacteria bacterium]|nr:lysoplasmalogenase [Alphaproteobacteria bacterium]